MGIEERVDGQPADDWGRDPSVRRMRQVFAAMERGHRDFLEGAGLSAFDPRLRRWQERALALFQRAWAQEARGGGLGDVGVLYLRCLNEVVAADGVALPPSAEGPGKAPR